MQLSVSTIAGSGSRHPLDEIDRPICVDGKAMEASLDQPSALCQTPDGSIFVVEESIGWIRKIANGASARFNCNASFVAGAVERVAGSLDYYDTARDGTALQVKSDARSALVCSPAFPGMLLFCAEQLSTLRCVDFNVAPPRIRTLFDGHSAMGAYGFFFDVVCDLFGNVFVGSDARVCCIANVDGVVAKKTAHSIVPAQCRDSFDKGCFATVAGSDAAPGYHDGFGSEARFSMGMRLALDNGRGSLFVSEGRCVREILPAAVALAAEFETIGVALRYTICGVIADYADECCTHHVSALWFIVWAAVVRLIAGDPTKSGWADGPCKTALFSNQMFCCAFTILSRQRFQHVVSAWAARSSPVHFGQRQPLHSNHRAGQR